MQTTGFIALIISMSALAVSGVSAAIPVQIILPANVIVAADDTASFQVTLSTAAPSDGVFIALTSSDPSKVTVRPENVFIPQGATSPSRPPTVNGITNGSALVTASATGLASASGQVQVGSNLIAPVPTITSFAATPTTIVAGQLATLSWGVLGANTISIDNGVGDVSNITSKSVSLVQTTTYILTATNSVGRVTAHATVTVGTVTVPGSGQILLPGAMTVAPGESAPFRVTLATAAPPDGVFIALTSSDPSKVTVAPTNIFIPQGATMPSRAPNVSGIGIGSAILTASASGLASASQQVQVGSSLPPTPAPAIMSFTASPSTITAGQPATMSWSVSGANTLTIDNGVGNVSNVTSMSVFPTQTTTYILTATNSGGSTTARVTTRVNPVPDTQAPTAPTIISAVAKGQAEVDLLWTASTDNIGVAGYQISRNGSVVTSVSSTSLSYTDTSVIANTTYAYSLKAYDAAGNYSSSSNSVQVTTPSTSSSTIITSCGSITQSGHYVLSGNLSSPPNASCINIHDAHDVYLDCQQHGVTIDRRTDPGNDAAIVVTNVTSYGISNCALTALNTTGGASLAPLSLINSPQGAIANNAFNGGYVTVVSSDNLQIAHNTSTAPFSISGNTQTIEYNTISLAPASYLSAAVLVLANSTGSVIQYNVLNGGWDGAVRQSYAAQTGADDGIAAYNVNNTIIQNNTILNTWDCGIENVRPMLNVQILNNQITTAGICGMGGWYGNSLRNVMVAGNTVTDAPRLFDYWRVDGLYAGNGEQLLFFKDNTFSNNKLVRPRVSFSVPGAGRLDFQNLPNAIPAGALVSGNNNLANNDFGPFGNGLGLLPASSVVDGGGNVCVPDPTSGFPLRCTPPIPPSGGYYAITVFSAAPVVVAPGSSILILFGASPGTVGDYIGLAAIGADDQHFLSTQLTGGLTSNTLTFTAPASPGQYELRYMKMGASGHVAVSNPMTVGGL